MARTDNLNNFLTDVAEAIREKKGTTETINASSFDEEIKNLPSGGGEPVTKGVAINSHDSDGYPTDISVVGMTEIPSYFFYYSMHNTSSLFSRVGANLHFPSNLTSIGNYAFYNCKNLKITSLPETLTSIGANAFQSCSNLAITSLPVGVTYLNGSTFNGCSVINELTINGNLTHISSYCFTNCGKLNKLVIPNITSVPTLDTNAFTNTAIAKGAGYVYIPDTLVEEIKSATNWSAIANQIKGVSEL